MDRDILIKRIIIVMACGIFIMAAILLYLKTRHEEPAEQPKPAAEEPQKARKYNGKTVAEWIAQLGEKGKASMDAMEQITDIGKPAVPELADTLKESKDARLRANVVLALGQVRDESAVPALIEALHDDDENISNNAVLAIEHSGKCAIPALSAAIKKSNGAMRANIVLLLGQIGDKSAVPVLLKEFEDESPMVRDAAIIALAMIRDRSTIPVLIKSLELSRNENVEKMVASSLKQMTRQNFGRDYAKWLQWWEQNKNNIK